MLIYILISLIFLDVKYFIRMTYVFISNGLFSKIKLLEKSTIYDICFLPDIDIFFKNMSHARYSRDVDFCKTHHFGLTGICTGMLKCDGIILQGASSSHYHEPISLFEPFKIETQMIYWDKKCFYLKHEFITLMDNILRAVILTKNPIVRADCSVIEFFEKLEPGLEKPELLEDLKLWIESMEESSRKYKTIEKDSQLI